MLGSLRTTTRVANKFGQNSVNAETTGPCSFSNRHSYDVTLLSKEDEDDYALAEVVAGLCRCEHLVQKDQGLAAASASLMKGIDVTSSQADALRLSLNIDIKVFKSLIELGLTLKTSMSKGGA